MARDGEFAKHVKEHPQFKEMTIRGWEHLTSSRFDTMIETLDWFEKKYGG